MGKFGLNFFKPTEKFNGNWSVLEHKSREWEKMYRERWSHDKVVKRRMVLTVLDHVHGKYLSKMA